MGNSSLNKKFLVAFYFQIDEKNWNVDEILKFKLVCSCIEKPDNLYWIVIVLFLL